MDPVTAIGIATTAYKTIVSGFKVGKQVESMSKDLGRWMGAIQAVKDGHKKKKSRSFGSVEEMDRLIADFAKQKEDAERLASVIREQDKQIHKAYKELEDTKSKNEKEKAYLHNKIRGMATGFSKRKERHEQTSKANAELKDSKSKHETENIRLQKKLRNLEELLPERKNQ